MKHRMKWLVGCIALGLIWAMVTQLGEKTWLMVPLWYIGDGLRMLSLQGGACNVAAWALVGIAVAIPLGYMGVRKLRKKGSTCDWLLPVIAIQIGTFLYFLVNPTLTQYPGDMDLADGFAFLYTWGLVSTVVGYLLLRVLRRIRLDATSGQRLPLLLQVSGLILAGFTAYNDGALLLIRIQSTMEANTGDVSFTVGVLIAMAICQLIPAVLGGVTLLYGGDVAKALMTQPYEGETIALCHKVAKWCNKVAVCSVLVSVGCNLFQVVLASQLFQTNITVDLPLLTLLLSSALYLLCHYSQGAKTLADDNDSII